jgi:hypothetical protein
MLQIKSGLKCYKIEGEHWAWPDFFPQFIEINCVIIFSLIEYFLGLVSDNMPYLVNIYLLVTVYQDKIIYHNKQTGHIIDVRTTGHQDKFRNISHKIEKTFKE